MLILVEKPAEAGGAPLGGRLKLCEGDSHTSHMKGDYYYRYRVILGNI